MRLVIAEKPSVGKTIAKAIASNPTPKDGYMDCGTVDGEPTLVSWAQGHLVDLADPKAYGDKWKKWSLDGLPVDPGDQWKWEVSREKGAEQRYKTLLPLMNKAASLIDACDPDREGSGIFHRIVRQAGLEKKPAYRLWTNSMDADGIRQAWKKMRPESETIGLAHASDARAKADWIEGMTASRAYTLLYDRRCSIGRVETPTLAMIVERDRQISGHVPTPYWTITIPLGPFSLTSDKINDQATAQSVTTSIGSMVTIGTVERKNQQQNPPRLYDLTSLQRDANNEHGLTAAQTLAALQSLYEKGLATYPRTDSQYITTDDIATLQDLLHRPFLASPTVTGTTAGQPDAADQEQPANNEKVEGHTALLPTGKLDEAAWDSLSDDEQKVIGLIVRRMWEATGRPRLHRSVKATAIIDNVKFTASQDTTTDPGWTAYSKTSHAQQPGDAIPDSLTNGASLPVTGTPQTKEGHTAPPKPYTDATLLSAMEHAGRLVKDDQLRAAIDDDTVHSGGLGTPATRAGIIDKIIKNKYARRDGKKIISTKDGQTLIDIAAPGLKAVESTGRMEQGLTDIAEGKIAEQEWMGQIHEQALRILPDAQAAFKPEYRAADNDNAQESFGPCPICGKPVVKTRSGYWKCSANRKKKAGDEWVPVDGACTYGIWKKTIGNNKKRLTDALVRKTLSGERPRVKGAFHSKKTGKDYDLILVLDKKWGIESKFPPRDSK